MLRDCRAVPEPRATSLLLLRRFTCARSRSRSSFRAVLRDFAFLLRASRCVLRDSVRFTSFVVVSLYHCSHCFWRCFLGGAAAHCITRRGSPQHKTRDQFSKSRLHFPTSPRSTHSDCTCAAAPAIMTRPRRFSPMSHRLRGGWPGVFVRDWPGRWP